MKVNEEKLSFEEALHKMQDIVNNLEKESVSLEESINLYQEGMEMYKICNSKLEQAQLRIKALIEKDDELVEREIDFDFD